MKFLTFLLIAILLCSCAKQGELDGPCNADATCNYSTLVCQETTFASKCKKALTALDFIAFGATVSAIKLLEKK